MNNQTEIIIIPNFEDLVANQPELLSFGENSFAQKVKDQLKPHTNTIINVGGSEFKINDDQKKAFITYFENNEREKVVVFLTFVNNDYWLGTMNTTNGLTIIGGCEALWKKNPNVYEFKSILGFLTGYGKTVDYRTGVTKTDEDDEITLITNSGILLFYGKRIAESDSEHLYQCAKGSFYEKIKHNLTENLASAVLRQ